MTCPAFIPRLLWPTVCGLLLLLCSTGFTPGGEPNPDATTKLVIQDSSHYSTEFIARLLSSSAFANVELLGDRMIYGKAQDTAYFPAQPAVGETVELRAMRMEIPLRVTLTATRVNQTTIDYEFEITRYWSGPVYYRGQAHLLPEFALQQKTAKDPDTGTRYSVFEFSETTDECTTSIQLGSLKEGGLRSTVKHSCYLPGNANLNDFPAFKQK